MEYVSTRDKSRKVSAAYAIANGIAPDGGLYCPTSFPALTAEDWHALANLDYKGRSALILGKFLTDFSAEELADYMEHMEILGGGGTDFRPAFQYVDSLIQKKAFTGLKGLIYFTDGYGMFPVKMPSYDTVFVFMRDDYSDADVPSWAMKLILGPEELDNGGTGAV